MCGHGIIGLVTVGIECRLMGLERVKGPIRIDTPAGRVEARASVDDSGVTGVSFRNVPSFLMAGQMEVEIPGRGSLPYDLAFGGAFYAYVESTAMGLSLEPGAYSDLIDLGRRIKQQVSSSGEIRHPSGDPDLNFLYGTIFVGPSKSHHSRNVCVFADGEVDRSPTGTGVSGRIAIHYARGEVSLNEEISIESILGTSFRVRAVEEVAVGQLKGVIPEVAGEAHITGTNRWLVDPRDPLGTGFLLR